MSLLLIIYAGLIGLCVGSFLNVVVYRLPQIMLRDFKTEAREILELPEPTSSEPKLNLSTPASHCPHCKNRIKWWMNIPVLSYLLLKGRCGFCDIRISIRYPLVELFTGLVSVAIFSISSDWQSALGLTIAAWLCIALMLIDLDTFYLPDIITLPLLWLGLVLNSLGMYTNLFSAVWGAVIGYLLLWSVYWFFKLVFKKEGMGGGDFKLLAAMGAWFGWQALPSMMLLSAGVGTLISLVLIITKQQEASQKIPFGPYLGMAFLVYIFWGETIDTLMLGA